MVFGNFINVASFEGPLYPLFFFFFVLRCQESEAYKTVPSETILGGKNLETYPPWVYRPAFYSLWHPLLLALPIVEFREQLLESLHRIWRPNLLEQVYHDGAPVSPSNEASIPLELREILGSCRIGIEIVPRLSALPVHALCLTQWRCCLPVRLVT